MERWEEYQHEAAALLRELGFSTEVNAQLTEANDAVHAIDVAARRTVAGVDLLWIVECKLWNKPVDMGAVRDLRTLVLDLGADHGLLMSESGFQSGAIMAARQKNITLTGLEDLRANAADEILTARVATAEKSLMDLSLRVNLDLRPGAKSLARKLASYAAHLQPEVLDAFAARPQALSALEIMTEVVGRVFTGLTGEDHLALVTLPEEIKMPWRLGADHEVMDNVALTIQWTTEALYQGRLGQWPAMCVDVGMELKFAWSIPQLLDVMEPALLELERKIAEQEAVADHTPRPPWLNVVKPGTLPPKHVWRRGASE